MKITINGLKVKLIEYSCSPFFIDIGDRVQTLDGVDHIENSAMKRIIEAKTVDMYRKDMMNLINALRPTYLTVTYLDPMSDREETRIFTKQGDLAVAKKMWRNGKQFYAGLNLNLQEKGAEY